MKISVTIEIRVMLKETVKKYENEILFIYQKIPFYICIQFRAKCSALLTFAPVNFFGCFMEFMQFSDRNAQLACQSCTPCEHSYDFLFLHEINSPEFVSIIGLRKPSSYRSVQKSVQNLEYLHGDLSKKIP